MKELLAALKALTEYDAAYWSKNQYVDDYDQAYIVAVITAYLKFEATK